MELALPSILLFSLSLSPPPALTLFHRTQRLVRFSHPTWGSSSVRSGSSREGRQRGFSGAMALSGLFQSETVVRPSRGGFLGENLSEQVGGDHRKLPGISLDFVSSLQLSATLLVRKILYILLLVHEPASSTLPGSLLEMQSLRPYLRPVESEIVF